MSTAVDWMILNEKGVMPTCAIQARKVAEEFAGVIEYSDLLQEAYISVATHPAQFWGYIEDDAWGHFAHAVWTDLLDVAKKYTRQSNNEVSYDALTAAMEGDEE